MAYITCFGEALVDFLNTDQQMEGPLAIDNFRQFPGGAPANVAVAISKLGGEARFVGQVGDDRFGNFLIDAMNRYEVDTSLVSKHHSAKTALAFVSLNDDGERSFEFYRDRTADLLLSRFDVKDQWFINSDVFHICSNTLTDNDIAETTLFALEKARKQGCLVSFDINLRLNLWPENKADVDRIKSCFAFTDVIKVSKDELDYLEPDGEIAFVKAAIECGVKIVIITDGANPVKIIAKGIYSEITPPITKAVDTTAAGDAFIGGFLFALTEQGDLKQALSSQETLEQLALFASRCGAFAVSKPGAYTSLPTLDDISGDQSL